MEVDRRRDLGLLLPEAFARFCTRPDVTLGPAGGEDLRVLSLNLVGIATSICGSVGKKYRQKPRSDQPGISGTANHSRVPARLAHAEAVVAAASHLEIALSLV